MVWQVLCVCVKRIGRGRLLRSCSDRRIRCRRSWGLRLCFLMCFLHRKHFPHRLTWELQCVCLVPRINLRGASLCNCSEASGDCHQICVTAICEFLESKISENQLCFGFPGQLQSWGLDWERPQVTGGGFFVLYSNTLLFKREPLPAQLWLFHQGGLLLYKRCLSL